MIKHLTKIIHCKICIKIYSYYKQNVQIEYTNTQKLFFLLTNLFLYVNLSLNKVNVYLNIY